MESVKSQRNEHDKVGDQQHHVEAVGAIQSLERGVEDMGADPMPKAALLDEESENGNQTVPLLAGIACRYKGRLY
jgi:hypothetical protein